MINFTLPPLNFSNRSGADGNTGGNLKGTTGAFAGALSINTGQGGRTSASASQESGNKTLLWVGTALAALWIVRH